MSAVAPARPAPFVWPSVRPHIAGLVYDDDTRDHTFQRGRLQSVTQILTTAGKCASFEKVKPQVMAVAGRRGTAVHLATQLYDEGVLDDGSVDERIGGYIAGWKQLRQARRLTPFAREVVIFSREYGYTGKLDYLGLVDQRTLAILDLKTGDPAAARTELQLVAYELALLEEFPQLAGMTVLRWAVQLFKNGRYKLTQYDAFRHDKQEFLSALTDVRVLMGITWSRPPMTNTATFPEPLVASFAEPIPDEPMPIPEPVMDEPMPEPTDEPIPEPMEAVGHIAQRVVLAGPAFEEPAPEPLPEPVPEPPADLALAPLPAAFSSEALPQLDAWVNERDTAVARATVLATRIRTMDAKAYVEGTEYADFLKTTIDKAKAYFDPIVAEARAPWDRRCAERRSVVEPLETAYKALATREGALSWYAAEEERIAREEQARLQREADERAAAQRHEQEAIAARERQESERIAREAEAARRQGDQQKAAELLSQAVEQRRAADATSQAAEQIQAPVVSVTTTARRTTSSGGKAVVKDDWIGEVKDKEAFVLAIARPDIYIEVAAMLRAGELTPAGSTTLTTNVIADALEALAKNHDRCPVIDLKYVAVVDAELQRRAKADGNTGLKWPGITFRNAKNVGMRSAR